MEKIQSLKTNDAHIHGNLLPEITDFSFFHLPEDENVLIGFEFKLRLSKKTVSFKFIEGESEKDETQNFKYLRSGKKFSSLIEKRHELISDVQTQILEQLPQILSLLDDIQSS